MEQNSAELVNNYDWFKDFNVLNFIRDIGKHIPVNYMMAKDSVKSRLETGMSFTEFTYQLIQGYDFFTGCIKTKTVNSMRGSDHIQQYCHWNRRIRRKAGGEAFACNSFN